MGVLVFLAVSPGRLPLAVAVAAVGAIAPMAVLAGRVEPAAAVMGLTAQSLLLPGLPILVAVVVAAVLLMALQAGLAL